MEIAIYMLFIENIIKKMYHTWSFFSSKQVSLTCEDW